MTAKAKIINRLINRLRSPRGLGVLSARSVGLLLCLIYLFLGPIAEYSDIISAALAYGLLGVVGILVLYVAIFGVITRLNARLTILFNSGEVHSNEPSSMVITLAPIRIPALLALTATVRWKQPGVSVTHVSFSGRGRAPRTSTVSIAFPHRGSWAMAPIQCTFSDFLGLVQFRWSIPTKFILEVTPPVTHDANIPVVSSSYRPGDLVTDTLNKEGDHYDLKRYHPSDGVKKIVWKVFAKRGELLSRHPEASITPEGYVLVFVCARKGDDDVASRSVAYISMLQDLQIDIVASCEGAHDREIAASSAALRDLLCDSVWDAESSDSLIPELSRLLSASNARTSSTRIDKIVLFCSERRFTSARGGEDVRAAAAWLATQGITPLFVVSQEFSDQGRQSKGYRLFEWVFLTPNKEAPSTEDKAAYRSFISHCLQNNWEVLV